MNDRELSKERTNSSKHLLGIGIAESAVVRLSYGSTEGGQEDDVIGLFLEDIFQSFRKMCHYSGRWKP